jgi:hypothetical protein
MTGLILFFTIACRNTNEDRDMNGTPNRGASGNVTAGPDTISPGRKAANTGDPATDNNSSSNSSAATSTPIR